MSDGPEYIGYACTLGLHRNCLQAHTTTGCGCSCHGIKPPKWSAR